MISSTGTQRALRDLLGVEQVTENTDSMSSLLEGRVATAFAASKGMQFTAPRLDNAFQTREFLRMGEMAFASVDPVVPSEDVLPLILERTQMNQRSLGSQALARGVNEGFEVEQGVRDIDSTDVSLYEDLFAACLASESEQPVHPRVDVAPQHVLSEVEQGVRDIDSTDVSLYEDLFAACLASESEQSIHPRVDVAPQYPQLTREFLSIDTRASAAMNSVVMGKNNVAKSHKRSKPTAMMTEQELLKRAKIQARRLISLAFARELKRVSIEGEDVSFPIPKKNKGRNSRTEK